MDVEDDLTNEEIMKKRESIFDLVNYAIKVAENMIHSGRMPRVRTKSRNVPLQILSEIASGKEIIEEIVERPTYHDERNRHENREPRQHFRDKPYRDLNNEEYLAGGFSKK